MSILWLLLVPLLLVGATALYQDGSDDPYRSAVSGRRHWGSANASERRSAVEMLRYLLIGAFSFGLLWSGGRATRAMTMLFLAVGIAYLTYHHLLEA